MRFNDTPLDHPKFLLDDDDALRRRMDIRVFSRPANLIFPFWPLDWMLVYLGQFHDQDRSKHLCRVAP
ncbi:MAG: hypothetical protein FWD53_01025 [Phycisphaerales bacterium]|nr:hypothetical protein [Phycisphaerales bacterium]